MDAATSTTSSQRDEEHQSRDMRVVDIGVNLTHRAFRSHWREVVSRGIDAGVTKMLLTGTSIDASRQSLQLAQEWSDETGNTNLYATVGVHPHDAKTWTDQTLEDMRVMLQHPLGIAVGECGLDFNRNFSPRDDQIHAFREQVQLAMQLNKPLFVHEREAHKELLQVLDEVVQEGYSRRGVTTNSSPLLYRCKGGGIGIHT